MALSLKAAEVHVSNVNSREQIDEALHLLSDMDAQKLDLIGELIQAKDHKATSGQTRHDVHQLASRRQTHKGVRRLHGRTLTSNETLAELPEIPEVPDLTTALDTMWLMFCGTFVFFMHAGFAMLEAGTGRAKNVQAILIKNLITVCMGTLGWYTLGWSVAYGGDVKTVSNWVAGEFEDCPLEENPMGCPDGYADNGFMGGSVMLAGSGFLGKGEAVDKLWAEGTIDPATHNPQPGEYMWFFQWAFCTASASIVSGGIAERVKFPAYMLFSFCMSAFIYPVIVCSTWGYGWLETWHRDKAGNPVGGYIDFAGSGVVHLCGGIGALAGAIVLGRRAGRFEVGEGDEFNPHSMPLVVIGTFILWFGWCGFNSGSTLGLSDSGTALMAGHVMMNTTLAAATGAITVFLVTYAMTRMYDCAALCNGILGGLVSITAGCSNVESGSAVLIGFLGGCIYVASSALLKRAKIDDPVDAFSVHGACGIWGCLAAALFDFGHGMDKHHGWGGFSATSWTEADDMEGLFKLADGEVKYMTTADALQVNALEIAFVINWSGGLSFFLFGCLRLLGLLRVNEEKESLGSDSECASPNAYNVTPWGRIKGATSGVQELKTENGKPKANGNSSGAALVKPAADLALDPPGVVPAPNNAPPKM